jgi:hypothetical protein
MFQNNTMKNGVAWSSQIISPAVPLETTSDEMQGFFDVLAGGCQRGVAAYAKGVNGKVCQLCAITTSLGQNAEQGEAAFFSFVHKSGNVIDRLDMSDDPSHPREMCVCTQPAVFQAPEEPDSDDESETEEDAGSGFQFSAPGIDSEGAEGARSVGAASVDGATGKPFQIADSGDANGSVFKFGDTQLPGEGMQQGSSGAAGAGGKSGKKKKKKKKKKEEGESSPQVDACPCPSFARCFILRALVALLLLIPSPCFHSITASPTPSLLVPLHHC